VGGQGPHARGGVGGLASTHVVLEEVVAGHVRISDPHVPAGRNKGHAPHTERKHTNSTRAGTTPRTTQTKHASTTHTTHNAHQTPPTHTTFSAQRVPVRTKAHKPLTPCRNAATDKGFTRGARAQQPPSVDQSGGRRRGRGHSTTSPAKSSVPKIPPPPPHPTPHSPYFPPPWQKTRLCQRGNHTAQPRTTHTTHNPHHAQPTPRTRQAVGAQNPPG
jgi:hypothetical protein